MPPTKRPRLRESKPFHRASHETGIERAYNALGDLLAEMDDFIPKSTTNEYNPLRGRFISACANHNLLGIHLEHNDPVLKLTRTYTNENGEHPTE